MSATRISQVSTRIILPQQNEPATPTLAFGNGTDGIYQPTGGVIGISTGGAYRWAISSSAVNSNTSGGGRLQAAAATATAPSLVPSNTDTDTGIGAAAADQLSLIAGGVEGIRIYSTGKYQLPLIATASAPAYAEGAVYFDSTLHKLRIGGAAAWETVTSA